ncbi:hypothetical protein BJ508DRAFT_357373 [Ascobolus immersus RN42]|uniref:Uncharacterized protein n=1 Tax=Ascobolus immersus RN42 TaxID=1160509 RepID=A0A3N4IPC6_ASCIM|nr:hypothetical protein BJ508DRAFT_357373 [Ascobolus immersus RN42]
MPMPSAMKRKMRKMRDAQSTKRRAIADTKPEGSIQQQRSPSPSTSSTPSESLQYSIPSAEHWLDSEEEEESEVEITDSEEEASLELETGLAGTEEEFRNGYAILMREITSDVWDKAKFPYQRGVKVSRQTIHNRKKEAAAKAASMKDTKRRIQSFFPPVPHSEYSAQSSTKTSTSQPTAPYSERLPLPEAIELMEKKLKEKRNGLQGDYLIRHRAVLIFMNFQHTLPTVLPGTRLEYARLAAKAFRHNIYYARKIISWEIQWRRDQKIEEGRKGCHVKTKTWFNDEGVQLAAREFVQNSEGGRKVTAAKLAKAIGEYLASDTATGIVSGAFNDTTLTEAEFQSQANHRTRRVTARTARRWLKKMGFRHCRMAKGVFYDGHERDDVVKYRKEEFLPKWLDYRARMVQFSEDGSWKLPEGCSLGSDGNYYMNGQSGVRPVVLVTHDESTFNANDGKRSGWFKVSDDGKPQFPIQPKGRGKGIMVSAFLTPAGILRVPNTTTDEQLLSRNPGWPRHETTGKLIREAAQYLEYSKDNYWTGDKMVDQTIQIALPIFREAFPQFQALFAFDNASNHSAFAEDALVASRMNLEPGGKKPCMRETSYEKSAEDKTLIQQSMVFPPDYWDFPLRNKPKGIKVVLRERGLWPASGKNEMGYPFRLDCPTSHGRDGCPTDKEDPDLGPDPG